MVLPASIAGGSAIGSSALTNYTNYRLAKTQQQFQERMSNTAYQRAVKDMRAASLNPALAYQQGGASSPSGAKAEMEDSISRGVSSALDVRRAQAEVDNLRQQNKLLQAQTDSERGKPWNVYGSVRKTLDDHSANSQDEHSAKSQSARWPGPWELGTKHGQWLRKKYNKLETALQKGRRNFEYRIKPKSNYSLNRKYGIIK